MTVTIYEGYDKTYVIFGCKDERFRRAFGSKYEVPVNNIYRELSTLAEWVNNELGEECLFEVD